MELKDKINSIMELCGTNQQIIIRKFHVGKVNPIEAVLLYKDGLVNQDIINRDILNPLMHQVDETKTMNMLKENNVKGILTIQKNAKEYTNYYATSKRKVSCTKKGDKYNFTINIDLKGDIITDTLYKDLQNSTEKNAEFNKKMAEEVKKKCDDFIVKMNNQYKVDCLDLGEVAAAKYGRQTGVDWNSIVCNSKIEVNVKVKVQKTGRGEY